MTYYKPTPLFRADARFLAQVVKHTPTYIVRALYLSQLVCIVYSQNVLLVFVLRGGLS